MTMLTERPRTPTTDRDTFVSVENPRRGRGWMWLSIVLAVALVGLGIWFIVDQTSEPATAPTDEVTQLIDDYHAAWNDHDGDAFLALVTDDFVFSMGNTTSDATSQANIISTTLSAMNWHVAQLGEPLMVGDGPWYVSVANEITSTGNQALPDHGISVVKIVDDGGTLQIASHTYIGES